MLVSYDVLTHQIWTARDCNVFVWCPLTSGCAAVGGGNATAPFLSCQLQRQAGLGGQPGALPAAWQRGPPASFVSGAPPASAARCSQRLAYTAYTHSPLGCRNRL